MLLPYGARCAAKYGKNFSDEKGRFLDQTHFFRRLVANTTLTKWVNCFSNFGLTRESRIAASATRKILVSGKVTPAKMLFSR